MTCLAAVYGHSSTACRRPFSLCLVVRVLKYVITSKFLFLVEGVECTSSSTHCGGDSLPFYQRIYHPSILKRSSRSRRRQPCVRCPDGLELGRSPSHCDLWPAKLTRGSRRIFGSGRSGRPPTSGPARTASQDGRTTTNTRRADEGSGNLAASPVAAFHCAAGRPAD